MVGWQRCFVLVTLVVACNQAPADEYAFTYGVTVSGSGASGDPATDGAGSSGGPDVTGSTGGWSTTGGGGVTGDAGSSSGAVSGSTGGGTTGGLSGGSTGGASTTGASTSSTSGTSTGTTTGTTTGMGTSTTGGVMGFACETDNPRPVLSCGQQHMDSFIGNYGDMEEICGESMLYQDQLFELTPPMDTQVTLTFTANPDPGNGAIFVMEGVCNAGACLDKSTSAGDYHQLTFQATGGTTYYIDLELPSQQPSYTLSVVCN